MNHKAGTQRIRTNVIERDIDCSCVQYIYTYRTSDESQGGDTEVTYKRNRNKYRLLTCTAHQMNHKAGTQRLRTNDIENVLPPVLILMTAVPEHESSS